MFGNKKTPPKPAPTKGKKVGNQGNPPRNSPLTAYAKARITWFENYGSAVVEKNRYFVITLSSVVATVALGISVSVLVPLKEVVPYVITTNKDTGAVSANDATAQVYKPDDAVKKWWVRRFVEMLFTIDRFKTKDNLKEVYAWISGRKAIDEFNKFIFDDKPFERIKQDINLTRTVEVKSIQFLQEGGIVARFTTDQRSGTGNSEIIPWVITLHYAIDPSRDEEKIQKNPLGMYFTHMDIVKEIR